METIKCQICKKKNAEYICIDDRVRNSNDIRMRYECADCESLYGYKIDFARMKNEDDLEKWNNHLNRRRYYDSWLFNTMSRRVILQNGGKVFDILTLEPTAEWNTSLLDDAIKGLDYFDVNFEIKSDWNQTIAIQSEQNQNQMMK